MHLMMQKQKKQMSNIWKFHWMMNRIPVIMIMMITTMMTMTMIMIMMITTMMTMTVITKIMIMMTKIMTNVISTRLILFTMVWNTAMKLMPNLKKSFSVSTNPGGINSRYLMAEK